MKWISCFLFLAGLLISNAAISETITVLSYNIKGLPEILGPSHDRFREIGKILKQRRLAGTQPDVVLLQEAFVKRVSELNDEAGYAFVAKGPDSRDAAYDGQIRDVYLNSGLLILSDHPIIATDKTSFGDICRSWDCKANKGVQLAVIKHRVTGREFAVYNTHLQASKENSDIRMKQMNVMAKFIESHGLQMPTFFIGDFNSNPQRPCYNHWLKVSQSQNAGQICLDRLDQCHVPKETDKLMLVQNSKDQHFMSISFDGTVVKAQRNFTETYKGKPLSDHLGYEVQYQF